MKKAGIYVNDLYCGVLTEDEEGISPTMPICCFVVTTRITD